MRALGFEVKKADVLKVMKEYDKEATGKITFDDFYEVSKYIEKTFIPFLTDSLTGLLLHSFCQNVVQKLKAPIGKR